MILTHRLRELAVILRRTWRRTARADLGMMAAGIAFYGFLAIFPAVAAIIAIWGFAADPAIVRQELELARDVLPPEAFVLIEAQVEALLAARSPQLGWATALSTLLALWSARAGVAALVQGLNAIHHLPGRHVAGHTLFPIVLTLALVGIVLAALVAAVGVPVAVAFLPLGRVEAQALELANTALGLALVILGLALAYRYGPNRPRGSNPPLFTRGLLVALLLWALVSRGFVIYLANFGSYNQIYGSIGAVVALQMWLYLSAYAVLLGAAVDAERQNRVRR